VERKPTLELALALAVSEIEFPEGIPDPDPEPATEALRPDPNGPGAEQLSGCNCVAVKV
jgi:hypothetical protein